MAVVWVQNGFEKPTTGGWIGMKEGPHPQKYWSETTNLELFRTKMDQRPGFPTNSCLWAKNWWFCSIHFLGIPGCLFHVLIWAWQNHHISQRKHVLDRLFTIPMLVILLVDGRVPNFDPHPHEPRFDVFQPKSLSRLLEIFRGHS